MAHSRIFALASSALAAALAVAVMAPSASADENNGIVYLAVGSNYGGHAPLQYSDGGPFLTYLTNSVTEVGGGHPSYDIDHVTTNPVPSGYVAGATATLTQNGTGYSAPGGDGGSSNDVGDNPFVGDIGFETFCIEDTVDFYVGNYYYYTYGTNLDPTLAVQQTNSNLVAGVAWLYEQYATGNIALTSGTQAGEFQSTLWYLQGEGPDNEVGFYPTNDPTNPYYEQVLTHFGSLSAAEKNLTETDDTYDVQVLELTSGPDGTGSSIQDQLIYTGTPNVSDGGATLAMLGVALIGLAVAKRRLIFGG